MDITDYKILELLENNARISMRQLGLLIGLTPPAVTERVRRMEEAGIIEGYQAIINAQKIKNYIIVFINVDVASINFKRFIKFVEKNNNILECHHIIGGNCLLLKMIVEDMIELESQIEVIKNFGDTKTSIVLSSSFQCKSMSEYIMETK